MLVEVVKPFTLRGQKVNFGAVLDVPEGSLESLKGKVKPIGLAAAEREYFRALSRWWELDDDLEATKEEARRLSCRLDLLYQMLHRQGRKVPIRLPVERHRDQGQRELAL